MPEAGGASFLPSWLRSSPGRGKKKGASKNNNKGSAAPSTPDAKQQQEQEAQRASAGVAAYNVTQLTALREHVASTALGLPATAACASLRTSNEALLAQLDSEIARQSSLLLAAQADAFGSPPSSSPSDDIDGRDGGRGGPKHHHHNNVPTSFIQPLPSTEVGDTNSLRSSNRAVARHFLLAQQARLAAQLEIRNAEAEAYVEHRAKLQARRVQALTRRLACYLVALLLLVAGFSTFLAVPAAHGILLFFVLTMALALVFVVMGYVMGESWRLRAASERELRRRIEARADEILAEFEHTYRVQEEEEQRRLAAQREEEERRKEAERIADEALLRAIEEAGKGKAVASSRRASRYGPGSVSSTDIKLPDSTSSCCEGENTTLHAGGGVKPSPQATTTTSTTAAIIADSEQRQRQETPDDNDDGDDSLVLPANNKTPRTAHAAVRRWFVGRVFGGDGAGGEQGGEVVEEEEEKESVWV